MIVLHTHCIRFGIEIDAAIIGTSAVVGAAGVIAVVGAAGVIAVVGAAGVIAVDGAADADSVPKKRSAINENVTTTFLLLINFVFIHPTFSREKIY
jgi:hypothetical protein